MGQSAAELQDHPLVLKLGNRLVWGEPTLSVGGIEQRENRVALPAGFIWNQVWAEGASLRWNRGDSLWMGKGWLWHIQVCVQTACALPLPGLQGCYGPCVSGVGVFLPESHPVPANP